MPRYVYRCAKGHVVELQRKVDERNMPVECERCPKEMESSTSYARPLMQREPVLTSPSFPGADRWR